MLCLCSCSSWGWAYQGPKLLEDSSVTYMLLLNCALKLVEEIILYYDARSTSNWISSCRIIAGLWWNSEVFSLWALNVLKWPHAVAQLVEALRKISGSIPDVVIGIFLWHNPSRRTMTKSSIHPVTEMSTRNISIGCKCGRCVGLTTLPPS